MPETTTLEIDGAKVTVETSALFRAWFERNFCQSKTPPVKLPLAQPGERYLGSYTDKNGKLCHIFLLPGDEKKNWKDSVEWAKSLGGDLPNRIEQTMLYAYMPEEFQKEYYWSNTLHAEDSDYAWCQGFYTGSQVSTLTYYELRARAVRREFANLVI